MNRALALSACLVTLVSVSPARGSITTTWRVTLTSQFDHVTRQAVPISVPSSFDLAISFPNVITNVFDYGTTTITNFGNQGDASISSPLSAFVGADPFGSGISSASPYAFAGVDDYVDEFIEQFVAQGNTFHGSGSMFWDHFIRLGASRVSPSVGGTGTADYPFTSQLLLAFLNDVANSPSNYSVSFSEVWQLYDSATNTHLGGTSWSGTASLTSVSTPDPNGAIPEPSGVVIWGALAMLGLGFYCRRAQHAI